MSNRAQRRRAEKLAREEVKRQIVKAAHERTCGDCTACCTTQGVKELGKPAGVPCAYLALNHTETETETETTASLFARSARSAVHGTLVGGCSRYATRPEGCRAWSCLWRLGMFDKALDRPDKRGLVFDLTGKLPEVWPAPTHQALIAREARPGAFEENEAWLGELSSTNVVVLVFPEGRRVLGPPDVVEEVERKMRRVLPVIGGAT